LELFALLLLVAGVLILRYFFKGKVREDRNKAKGKEGEQEVINELNKLDKDKYTVFNDITIQTRGGYTSQNDHIVVSEHGIFVIETKNYGGKIYGNDGMQKWQAYYANKKYDFYSPVKQSEGHIKALKNLLGVTDGSFIPLVVFTERGDIENTSSSLTTLTKTSGLLKTINDHKSKVFSDSEVSVISSTIKNNALTGKGVDKSHIKYVKSKQAR
jgi:hypothetical protein